jgi:hypothetical protein
MQIAITEAKGSTEITKLFAMKINPYLIFLA